MRAELRRQAAPAVVAAARCARRDTTRNYAFEQLELLWLHSCSGSLGGMNSRRLSHLKNAGASAALEIARQDEDVIADNIQEHISLSTLDMAQCVIAIY